MVKKLMGQNLGNLDMGIKLRLIQELIPLGLMYVGNILTRV